MNSNSLNIGKFNFTLVWYDPNDLDLYVTCPCGNDISFRNRRCSGCGGYLDKDAMNELKPVEHIFFDSPRPGSYKFKVHFYGGNRTCGGISGGTSSRFTVSVH